MKCSLYMELVGWIQMLFIFMANCLNNILVFFVETSTCMNQQNLRRVKLKSSGDRLGRDGGCRGLHLNSNFSSHLLGVTLLPNTLPLFSRSF